LDGFGDIALAEVRAGGATATSVDQEQLSLRSDGPSQEGNHRPMPVTRNDGVATHPRRRVNVPLELSHRLVEANIDHGDAPPRSRGTGAARYRDRIPNPASPHEVELTSRLIEDRFPE
jgi:hypothetical protein